jgi:hypothetical protein
MQYGQFEEALIRMFSINETNLGAFRARLRHLRKLNIPDVPKRGSGNTATYRVEDLFSTFVALALQTLGTNPTVSAVIARFAARYPERLRSEDEELFLIVTNVPNPDPENIVDTVWPPPGVLRFCWIKNSINATTFACIVSGAAGVGKFATHADTVASAVINLSQRFKALPKDA